MSSSSSAEATTAASAPPNVDGHDRTAAQTAQENGDQSGKIFLVTGAYSGIGVETTKALLAVGGKVIVCGRNAELQQTFVDELSQQDLKKVELIDGSKTVDLADLASVKEFCDHVLKEYTQIDCLILNAGVMMTPAGLTKAGFETQMGVNVVGHFLMAKLLLPLIQKAPHGRMVWLSSSAHTACNAPRIDLDYYRSFDPKTSKYDPRLAYQQSKLGDILLAKEFAKRHVIESVSVHPGVIKTNLSRHLTLWLFIQVVASILYRSFFDSNKINRGMKTPEQGAATTVTAATLPSEKLENGAYYANCMVIESSEASRNMDDAKALYDYCDEVTAKFQ